MSTPVRAVLVLVALLALPASAAGGHPVVGDHGQRGRVHRRRPRARVRQHQCAGGRFRQRRIPGRRRRGRPEPGDFDLEFAAPPGYSLVPGVYVDAQRAPFRDPGHPGIDISGDGRGCNEDTGSFEVLDIHSDAGGNVDRLWLVYEQHCEGGSHALFGEVRINEPVADDGSFAVPSLARWPAAEPGAQGSVVPLAIVGPQTIGQVALQGDSPSQFTIREDNCSNKVLAPGARCTIFVRYTPTSPGTHTATLRAGGQNVTLQGYRRGGVTQLDMTSDSGDYIGQGQTWSYSPAAGDSIAAGGGRSGVSFGIDGHQGDWWYGDFVPGSGDILTVGATYSGTRYPFNGPGPGLDVGGNGRGCNALDGSFTVNAATFEDSGDLTSMDLSFVQHCEGAPPALHGRFRWRAGDTTPRAPWMVGTPLGSLPPAPPFSDGAGTPVAQPPAATTPGATPVLQAAGLPQASASACSAAGAATCSRACSGEPRSPTCCEAAAVATSRSAAPAPTSCAWAPATTAPTAARGPTSSPAGPAATSCAGAPGATSWSAALAAMSSTAVPGATSHMPSERTAYGAANT